ncbi:MAG: RNA-binding protein [Thermodesulfobacteriota bacterium]
MNLYVGNLPYAISEDDLRNLFAEHGEVSRVNIITDRETGRSKGFAFVEMPNDPQAEEAIKNLNEKQVMGRNLKVNQARPQADRPARPAGGGGGNRRRF